jgi:hypothetical protein
MFKTKKLNFAEMKEVDVRADVIEPLLQSLGYESGTIHCLEREPKLRYPFFYGGRKRSGIDRPISKFPDFIIKVNSARAWIIETKPPDEKINNESIDQALSYANHPEINVPLFVICNGHRIEIFQTRQGDYRVPFVAIDYPVLESRYGDLASWLSPSAFATRFPRIGTNNLRGIAPGFGDQVFIVDGGFEIVNAHRNAMAALLNMEPIVREGLVKAVESGLMMRVKMSSGRKQIERQRKIWGHEWQECFSGDKSISADAQRPTVFSSQFIVPLREGDMIFDPAVNEYKQCLQAVDLEVLMVFSLSIDDAMIRGTQRCWMRAADTEEEQEPLWFEATCWFKCIRFNL